MWEDIRLPEIWYEKLIEYGWQEDVVNACVALEHNSQNALRWVLSPDEEQPESICNLEIDTDSQYGTFCLQINYIKEAIPELMKSFITFQTLLSSESSRLQDFFHQIIHVPYVTVDCYKFIGDWRKEDEYMRRLIRLDKSRIIRLFEPRWQAVEEIDFYLAGVLQQDLFISKEYFSAALEKIKVLYQQYADVLSEDELHPSSLVEAIENKLYEPPQFDQEGNIIGLKQGGDSWFLEELAVITEFIRPDSFLVLQDDGYELHKIVYTPQKVLRYSEDLTN